MLRCLILCVCVIGLSGCASRWEHASKSQSEFYDDDRDCQVETGGASKSIEPGSERLSYESCMWQKGWHMKKSIWFFDPQ
jgi:hypothetical protein